MSITVKLPSVLKKITGGDGVVQTSGGSVAEALEGVVRQFPELRERLFTPDSRVRPFLIICLNGEDIRFREQVFTPVADSDEISIIPAISGG